MIRLEGLRVKAGEFSLAIDDLSVAHGEYVMVLGPTASGKTVLLETVAGLRRPQAGRVWFGDRDVTCQAAEKRKAGLVYQDYALFPHLSVAQNIAFGLSTRGATHHRRVAGARVRELAEMLGIEQLLDRHPEGLSGGEQQRVALARALAVRPDVLLLDEPLSALDGPTRLELQGELKRLHRELGATVLHVTHDLDEALALGDRVAVLIDGRLRQVGAPLSVTRRPADVEVARLVGLMNLLPVERVGDGSAAQGVAGPTAGRLIIHLEDGRRLVTTTSTLTGVGRPLVAVIPAEEIEIELGKGMQLDVKGHGCVADDAGSENVMEGIISGIRTQSVHAAIEVELSPVAGETVSRRLTVNVLRPHVARLGLSVGSPVHLVVPASAVHVCTATPT